jgi:hypothetical protein
MTRQVGSRMIIYKNKEETRTGPSTDELLYTYIFS